jgi:serine/threonine kinase PknH
MPWEALPGDPAELAGYRISGRLGAGGMGRVYLAFTPAGRPVALKVLRPELGDDPEFRARFRQEVAAARRVSGLFTAQVLHADPDGSPPWLVTAYVAGQSLAQAVADHGPLPEGSVLLLAAGVAEALQGIHAAGLVHRDLKPSNVLLAADGPRVIDFGIARAAQATTLTRTGYRVGSPQFMAPEQVQGGPLSGAADVFALGALAAYAATGRPPFGDGDVAAVMYRVLHADPDTGGCPDPLRALITDCLAKDPSARPAPAQVVDRCRACAPGGTLEFTASWLPAAITAGLPPQTAARTRPMPPPTAPTAPAGAAMPPPSAAPPDNVPGALATRAAAGGLPPNRGWPRTAVAALAAAGVIVAALVLYGVTAAFHHAAAAGTPAANGAGVLDRCLFGTWRMISESNRLPDGQPETYYDIGGTTTYLPSGVTSTQYPDGATQSTIVNGVAWTYVYAGGFTGRYSTSDGTLRLTDMSGHVSYRELRDGSYFTSKSFAVTGSQAPQPYTCSAFGLRLSAPGGFTDLLARKG